MKRLGLRVITTCLLIGLAGCTSSSGSGQLIADRPVAKPIDFNQPATPQAAEKAYPPGDRTNQALQAVAARGPRLVAAGFDESDNLSRPLFLTSDDTGKTWTRRQLDKDSIERSSTFEGVTDLAAGPSGFVAIGDGYPGQVLWHSTDGTNWRRLATDRKAFLESDYLRDVTATPDGFAIVGGNTRGAGRLIYWRSVDGVNWRRIDGPSIGLVPTAAGEVSASEIVASGKTVVISGDLATPSNPEQSERLQYWYSTDGGRKFRAATVRGDIATEYRVYNNVLAVGDGKFVALAQGGGFDEVNDSWDGVVLEGGATGASWQVAATPWTLGSAFDDSPGSLVRAGRDWVATASVTSATIDTTVAVGPTWAQLADGTDAGSQRAPGTQSVADSVAIGNEAVMVGSNDRSGSTEPAVWRYAEARVTPVALPAEATRGRPSSDVYTLLRAADTPVAIGTVSHAPSAWTRSGSSWQATTLPGRTNGIRTGLYDATTTPDGRVVAVGEKDLSKGSRAAVWVRSANGEWSEANSPVFGVGARSPYGGPTAQAVAAGPGGWVIVGQRHDGDGHYDAWSAYSKDGKAWVEGVGGKVLPADPKGETRRTRATNLRSVRTDAASMTTVLAVGSRFVAGGDRGDGLPWVWLSPNGSDWQTVVKLPLAKGIHSASVDELNRIGNTLVAVGQYERKDGDTEGGWVSWTSKNGGLTWTVGKVVVPIHASTSTLVPFPNGILALGETGELEDVDAAAWFSADGLTWKSVPVPGERAKGPGRQGVVSGVVDGGKLLAVAYDIPPVGGGYYALEMDLPK
ncbi:hypothetical protein EV651_109328 [Kribbella sp. VKM Ac-2571]|uniref:hypothetical protein n=1 Tax=Kribbella sp. VKM Ac-2571 TaxID=2512222 RepID=UPI00105C8144|nr:hypothetical protein [Kribbella sp. VKM Ac-2571]TDO59053.1 hypothetical protein EV651_109328 [Kribbella sp. VKM Ac-2571]